MKRVLITGGSGLLGQYLNIAASGRFKVLTIYNNNTGNCASYLSSRTDIRNFSSLKSIFKEFEPEVVIHSAAITNVQLRTEQSTKDFFETNVKATKNIAELCKGNNTRMIFISTDLVYAGYRGSFLKEEAKLMPASLYAETKLMGEVKVRETTENHLILRTALLYGKGLNHSRCHFHFILENFITSRPVKLFIDQYRTPISLRDASEIIIGLAETDIKNETINLGGLERVSRFELGEVICNEAGFDKNLIEIVTMNDIPNLPRVEDVSLNTEKLQSLGFKARSIEENIHEIIKSFDVK